MSSQLGIMSPDALVESSKRAYAERGARSARLGTIVERFGVLLPFALIATLCIAFVPSFLSASNITNVLISASLTAIVGFGMTIAIALRAFDLSVGSTIGLTGCVTAMVVGSAGPAIGIIAGVAAGAAVGLTNGLVVGYLRVPAFVVTLGTLGIIRGTALLLTGGGFISIDNSEFKAIATGRFLGVPIPVIVALILLAVWYVVLERTPLGRHVCAIGGRLEAAVDSGIKVRSVTVKTFVIVGICAGITGVLTASQLGFVDGTLGTGLELQIIAIAVLGGTSLSGGSGNLVGTFIAAVLLAMISSGLNLLNVPSFYQYLAVGLLLLLALGLDSIRRRLQRRTALGI